MQIGILLQKVIIGLVYFTLMMWDSLAAVYPFVLPFDILFAIYYIAFFVPEIIYAYFYRKIYRMTGLSPAEFRRLGNIIAILLATIINLKYWPLTSEFLWDFVTGKFGSR